MDKLKRYELINQLLILEKLYPEEADYYSRNRKALENGYELHYSWLTENINDGLSEEQCKEVLDILDMYRSITFSWQRLHDGEEIPENLKFRGFDGNNETELMGYVQYFIIELDRFEELKYGKEHPYFNSHHPTLEMYRRMLTIWKEYDFDLTNEQIASIMEA
ncbi:YfbU family protein [Pseudomonas peli]|uniref:YfbU family protein n=1 Tax=Pseudomonas peli TaxID=592361 RepID=UPI003D31CEF2